MSTLNQMIGAVRQNSQFFPKNFDLWVNDNAAICAMFVEQTHEVIKRGFKHYGAHVIVQYIRHHTVLTEANSLYKIRNDVFPYLARMFAILHPDFDYIFDYRTTKTEAQFVPRSGRTS